MPLLQAVHIVLDRACKLCGWREHIDDPALSKRALRHAFKFGVLWTLHHGDSAGLLLAQTWAAPKARAHPIRQTTTPAPASGGGSPPSCSPAPATVNAPGSLMLFQVVAIQPSERCTCAMRNSSIWPLAAAICWSPSLLRSARERRRPHHLPQLRSPRVGCAGRRSSNRTHRAVRALRAPRRLPAGRSAAQRERAHIIT